MNPEWELFLKEHKDDFNPETQTEYSTIRKNYGRFARMKSDTIMTEFMDYHKNLPYPIYIDPNCTSLSVIFNMIRESKKYKDYKDLIWAPYAPVIKKCKHCHLTCKITDAKTNIRITMPGLRFVSDKDMIENGAEFAECGICLQSTGAIYTGYAYIPCNTVQNHRSPIKDKNEALRFINEHSESVDFYNCLYDGAGYASVYPWVKEYAPDLYTHGEYLPCDPIRLCIDKDLLKDPDIIAALGDEDKFIEFCEEFELTYE